MPTRPITPEQRADADRLRPLFHAWQEKNGVNQEEAAHRLGISQSALSQRIGGRLAINRDFAAKTAAMIGVSVSDFSPQLAADIKALTHGSTPARPAIVVSAAAAAPSPYRPTRPGLEKGLIKAFGDELKALGNLQRHVEVPGAMRLNYALENKTGALLLGIEFKTFSANEPPTHQQAMLTGQLWMLRQRALPENLPVIAVLLVEDASVTQGPGETEQAIASHALTLQEQGLLQGFTILRVHDKEHGDTELHDLPDTPQTLQKLFELSKQLAQNAKHF